MELRLGAHVSKAKGMIEALNKASLIRANCIQMFSSSPRSFDAPKNTLEECQAFKAEAQKRDIGPNFIHATYLINLGTAKPEHLVRSIQSLIADLQFAYNAGFKGVIVHTGSHVGTGFESIVSKVVSAVEAVLAEAPVGPTLYLEIASGGNGKIGSTFEELATLLEKINNARVGVCLDTAHMFVGGYPFGTPEELDTLKKKISNTIGWKTVGCMHTNDSKGAFGSGLDRHENIGQGKIGPEPFTLLLHDDLFSQLPFILEVPGYDGKGPDRKNLNVLKELV